MEMVTELQLYTSKQVIEKFNITKQRLHQLREGFWNKRNNTKYFIKPSLIEGRHWFWKQGKILYTLEGIRQLQHKYPRYKKGN